MARKCSICQHPEREQIELELARGTAVLRVSALFRASDDAITRHAAKHLQPAVARAQQTAYAQVAHQEQHAVDLLSEVRSRLERADRLANLAEGILTHASAAEQWSAAVGAVQAVARAQSEGRQCLELLARLHGQLGPDQSTSVSVMLNPEWTALQSRLIRVLGTYPDARQAVIRVLNNDGHARNGTAAGA
jgi:hypothetical protein